MESYVLDFVDPKACCSVEEACARLGCLWRRDLQGLATENVQIACAYRQQRGSI